MKRLVYSSALAALLAAALFGASAPFAKRLLSDIQPVPLAALLYLGSGAGTLLIRGVLWLAHGKPAHETRLTRADFPWLLGAMLAGGVAAPILLMVGLEQTPAATASLLLNFETAATSLIAFFVFREAIGRKVWLGIGAITLASVLLSWDSSNAWGFSGGALAVLGACVLWGIDNNFTRNISAKDPRTIVIFKGFGAGLFSTLLAALIGQPFPGPREVLLAMLLGAMSYGLSISLFILAMRGLGAARASAMFGSAPFIGMILSVLLLGESLTQMAIPAFVLMSVSAWLLLSEDHRHSHLHAALQHDHHHGHSESHHQHSHRSGESLEGEEHAHAHTHSGPAHDHPHNPDLHHRHEHPSNEE